MKLYNEKLPLSQQFNIQVEETIGKGQEVFEGVLQKWNTFQVRMKSIPGITHSAQERICFFKVYENGKTLEQTKEFLKKNAHNILSELDYNNPNRQSLDYKLSKGNEDVVFVMRVILSPADKEWEEAENWEHYRNLMTNKNEE